MLHYNAGLRISKGYMQKERNQCAQPFLQAPHNIRLTPPRPKAQAELERLKFELARLQKTNIEQSDRIDKQTKAKDALDVRLQETRKAALADQAEIKDLRVKLRMAEHEKAQLAGKQGEVGEAKKALSAAEARRREEVRERDRKVVELEKALAGEKCKRELAEAQTDEIRRKADEEDSEARALAEAMRSQVDTAKAETLEARTALEKSEGSYEVLTSQLEDHRALVSRVAQEYGRLASSTVSTATHGETKLENTVLQLRILRLERKLADTEGQAVELAYLARCAKEENETLKKIVKDGEEQIQFHVRNLKDWMQDKWDRKDYYPIAQAHCAEMVSEIEKSDLAHRSQIYEMRSKELEASNEVHRSACQELLSLCNLGDRALVVEAALAGQTSEELANALSERDSIAAELEASQAQLGEVTASLQKAEESNGTLAEAQKRLSEEASKNEEALLREREVTQRHAGMVQRLRIVENGLQAEIER
jgi:hypothetical protein